MASQAGSARRVTPCLECGVACAGPRCPAHRRKYGRPHNTERARWQPTIATGTVLCSRFGERPECPGFIQPTDTWDLDHHSPGRTVPAHADCNRAAHW